MNVKMTSTNPYESHPGKSPYLRCTYEEGPHPSERIIKFRTSKPISMLNIGRVVVHESTLVRLKGDKGLIGIFDIFSDDGIKSLIKIPDNDNGGESRRYVPNSEIVWR